MESLELRIFREVAYMKSITKAADKMGYVQSNITAHIKKLESELNTILFIRHNKGITLTDDGEKLLLYADKIIELLDKIPFEFSKKQKHLNIGATQTIAGYYLPEYLAKYRNQYSNTDISIATLNQLDIYNSLISGSVDCIFTNRNLIVSNTKEIMSIEENLVVIAPKSCTSLEDIIYYPLVVNNIKTCPYRQLLNKWIFSFKEILPEIIEMDTVESILKSVSLGLGISLLPEYIIIDNNNINKFKVEEIRSNKIHMLIYNNTTNSTPFELKSIIESNI